MSIGLLIDLIVISLGIIVGLTMIIGATRASPFVVKVQTSIWKYTFPDLLLRKLGPTGRRVYYLLMGSGLVLGMLLYGIARYH